MTKLTTINIHQGYLTITDGVNGQHHPGWCDDRPNPKRFDDIDEVYDECQRRGYSQERTIDVLLHIFHRQRMIHGDFLVMFPLVVGFIGGAGGGKSCGAAGLTIFDYLLAGWHVVSNMEIKVRVRYRDCSKVFRTENLDKIGVLDVRHLDNMYQNCLVFIDELNIEVGDSRRSMTNANLQLGAFLQSRRKRNVNVIWTSQSENWIDGRVRFGTDLYILCRDAAYEGGKPRARDIGRRSTWTIWDMSGRVTGRTRDVDDMFNKTSRITPFREVEFLNTPFWNTYDSWQLQGIDRGESDAEPDIQVRDSAELRAAKDKYKIGRKVAAQLLEFGVLEIPKAQLWKQLNCEDDRALQTTIGRDFAAIGIPSKNDSYIIQSDRDIAQTKA